MSPFLAIRPVVSSTHSQLPPVLKVTTGVPHARASILVVGKLSSKVGLINTSASEYKPTSSSGVLVRWIPITLLVVLLVHFSIQQVLRLHHH